MSVRVLSSNKDNEFTTDLSNHIDAVSSKMKKIADELVVRGPYHDSSKYYEPESTIYSRVSPKLKKTTYGSTEYNKIVDTELRPGLDHHYKSNRHHPEHFDNGVSDMDLVDIIEMVCDWKSANERDDTGDWDKALDHNLAKHVKSDELRSIIKNTVDRYLL